MNLPDLSHTSVSLNTENPSVSVRLRLAESVG